MPQLTILFHTHNCNSTPFDNKWICVHIFSGGYCLKSSRFNELAVMIIPNKVKKMTCDMSNILLSVMNTLGYYPPLYIYSYE